MRKFVILTTVVLVGAGMSFAFQKPGTFPVAWPYDGLVQNDHVARPVTPGALHLNASINYLMASEYFDMDGENQDLGGDATILAVPIDIGYAFDERILVDVTLQIIQNKFAPTAGEESSAFGLGDVWVKGRYVAPVGENFNLGGRLGVKAPVGKVDYDDTDSELGDNQMDIDVGLVAGMHPEMGFVMDGQVGFRYRMKETISMEIFPGETIDIEYTPGMLIYLDVEPGYSFGMFDVYVPIGYEMTMADKADGETVDDSETSGLYVGVLPKYAFDENNTIGVRFLYPVMGKLVHNAMMFGVTYEGYIPM